jgi:hypothetical protein
MGEPHKPDDLLGDSDFGASATFDTDGHLRGVDAYPPGRADGSDPLHWEPKDHDAAPAGPGWLPNQQPHQPDVILNDLPPPDGFHWDPVTHVPVSNAVDQPPAEADYGPGDYVEPDVDPGYV